MMKNYKRIILLACVVSMAGLSMSYQSGPALAGNQAATGAPFNTANCNDCHGGGSFGTTVAVELLSGATPVTTYLPGGAYNLRITINGTGGTRFGFQTTAAFQGTNTNINTWGALPANTHNALLGGRNYIEHSTQLVSNVITIPWTAPSSTLPISFYAAGNRVNNDSQQGGDHPNTGSLTVTTGCATIAMTPTSPPSGTVGIGYSQQLSQTGGVGTVTYALTSGTMPAGTTISGTGLISGTPTTPGTYNFTITATGSNGCSTAQAFTIVVNCPTITLTPASPLPQGTVGAAYNQVISQTGGTGTFTYTVTAGTLPLGVSLNTNGTLSGTPLVAGTYNFTVTGTNGTCSGVTAYTLVIGCPTITLNPTSLPNGTLGAGYNQVITQSGGGTGGYTYQVTSGTLPNGLTLNTNGTLSGTPSVTGSFTFTVTATGTQSTCTGTRTYTIVIGCPTITINPATIGPLAPGSTVNTPFTQTGGTGTFTYAFTAGTLPPGLSVTGGALTGTPSATGVWTFDITGTGPLPDLCTGTRTYTVNVTCPTISLSPMSPLPVGNINLPYSQVITVTGSTNTFNFTVTAGALPAGVTLNTNGTLSGTPTVSGTFNFTITAVDIYGCTTSTAYTWVISPCAPITLNPTTLPNGTLQTPYNQVITQTGGTNPVYTSSGTLPPGLTITTGGVLSGTPNTPGNYMFTIIVDADGGCSGSQAYTVDINCPTITLSPGTLPVDTVGQAYNEVITQTGSVGTTFDYTVTSGTLPPGITLALDGTLSGTGTVTGTYTFDVTMEDDLGCSVTVTYTIDVVCPVIVIDQTTVDTIFTATPYTTTLTQTGGTAPFTYTVTSGTLPAGITLGTDGVLSGTSTDVGTHTVTITVTDANGCTATQILEIVVSDPVSVVALSADKESIVLLPNIVTNNTTALIITNSSIKAELRVIDITGKTIYQNITNLQAGENRVSLDLHELSTGSYTLHVKPLRVAPVRFIKQ